jgi:hypothetical protein
MTRKAFEICNHTCGCILGSKRPHPLRDCMIFQKEGSSGRRHSKSAAKHPNCLAQCPAHGPNGIFTRDPTMEEWERWAPHLSQAYAHRPDLLAMIPLSLVQKVNHAPFKFCKAFSITDFLKSLRICSRQTCPQLPFSPTQRLVSCETLPSTNHLPPGLKRKKLPGQMAIYVVHPSRGWHPAMSTQPFRWVSVPRLLTSFLNTLYPQHMQSLPGSPNHSFTPKYVSQQKCSLL